MRTMGTSVERVMAVAGLINLIMPMSVVVDANCDYYQNVAIGQKFYIYSPNYPNKYKGGTSCKYVAETSTNAQIVLSCEVVDIPAATNCQQDRLSVSLTGNPNFDDALNYCGKGTLSLVSKENKLSVGLFAVWYSAGGRFLCAVTAIQSSTGPPTTSPPDMCDCGWRQERRIVGGVETGINEFPAMAALVNLRKRMQFCGATIIAVKYAISAAHCTINNEVDNTALLVGDHNIETGSDTASSRLYLLRAFIVHGQYDNVTQQNDIAVIKTQNIMDFSPDVGPICLPFRYSTSDFVGDTVIALGWGTTEFSGPKSDYLQKVNLSVVTNQKCQRDLTENRIFSSQFCTYAPGKDACQYDSGGPLLWYDSEKRRLHLVGVISYGVGCALELPGVNTRVTSFLAWIVSVTRDTDYCIK